MDATEAARRIPRWTQIPDGTQYAVCATMCRRCVMTKLVVRI